MINGKFCSVNIMQEWYLREIRTARQTLVQFKSLNLLFNAFHNYETKQYSQTKNVILRMCLPALLTESKQKYIESLTQIETCINLFDIINWKTSKLNEFQSRLCSDKYDDSVSVCTELLTSDYLADRLGKDKIELYPKLQGGGKSDILVKVNDKNIYIEVGNLDDSMPEKKIQKILQDVAEGIGRKLEQLNITCLLLIKIDTSELVLDNNGNIDTGNSTLKLISEFEYIQKYLQFNESIEIDIDKNELMKNGNKIIKFIEATKNSTLFVTIQTEASYPSKAASLEQKSFVNHILRNIKRQLEEEQIEPNEPNIIFIQGYNWTVFVMDELKPIINKIKTFFNECPEKYLSGIAVVGTDFRNIMYINNDSSADSSKLSPSEITLLGFNWF